MDSKKDVNNKQKSYLTKKEKENIRKGVLEEINDEVRSSLCENVLNDVNERINEEYKENLKETISSEIINDIKENIKEDEKKMSRRKNFKIVRLYIYILLLMAGSIFLIYKLYVTGNLDVVKDIKISTTTTTTTTALVKDLKWYMNKYGNILDNIKIDNVSLLKGNFDISKIDVKDKLSIAYNNLSSDSITKDGMIYSVKEEDLKNSYVAIFGSEDGYESSSFQVDGVVFAYSVSNASYMAVANKENASENILMEITNIKEEDGELVVDCITALVKESKLYNINNLDVALKDYNSGESLKTSENSLSKNRFTFKLINDKYYISSISII